MHLGKSDLVISMGYLFILNLEFPRRTVMTLQELSESNQQPDHGPLVGMKPCSTTDNG